MVRAWMMDKDEKTDQHQPHQENPPRFLSLEQLHKYGVDYWKIESEEHLKKIVEEGGYVYQDEVTCSREGLKNYDEMMKIFFQEHLHTDPETRLITEGVAYFDIRKPDTDEWVRIELQAQDMISLPAGIFHRFTPDTSNYVKARRFFQGDPVWTPHNRADGVHEKHNEYLESIKAL